MPDKKEQERKELQRTILNIANDGRRNFPTLIEINAVIVLI